MKSMELLLHLSLAMCIAVATRAIGALPVFAFLVLPAGAALLLSERMSVVLVLSVAIGSICATLGYYLSWTLSLPTGSVMVALCVGFWVLAGLKRLVEWWR